MRTPMGKYAKASRVGIAALSKTIALYDDRDAALEAIPALRMLSTTEANLESRAKRLAKILETYETVQYARVVEGRAVLCASSGSARPVASRRGQAAWLRPRNLPLSSRNRRRGS